MNGVAPVPWEGLLVEGTGAPVLMSASSLIVMCLVLEPEHRLQAGKEVRNWTI